MVRRRIRYIAVNIVFFARHKLMFLIRLNMPGRKGQRNLELKQASQSYSKLTYIFKKLKTSDKSKELSVSENQDIAISNMES